MTDMGSSKERGMIAVGLNAGELLVDTATFLYENSPHYVTGDSEKDLTDETARAFLDMSEALLVRIGVIPDGWGLVAQAYGEEQGATDADS